MVLSTLTAQLPSWDLSDPMTIVDLLAATINALNGAILARRPDHYRNYTVIGILTMAFLGGITGGIVRDVLLGVTPAPLLNPAYIFLCLAAGIAGFFLAYDKEQLFREGLFQFATSAALPWYAIVAAQKAMEHKLPVVSALLLAVVGATAGRYLIDLSSGVSPKQLVRGEFFVVTALIAGGAWIGLDALGVPVPWSYGLAFLVAFVFRVVALYRGWEEPLPKAPKGVRLHPEGRPLLGRKLAGRSAEELRMLGLDPATSASGTDARGGSNEGSPK